MLTKQASPPSKTGNSGLNKNGPLARYLHFSGLNQQSRVARLTLGIGTRWPALAIPNETKTTNSGRPLCAEVLCPFAAVLTKAPTIFEIIASLGTGRSISFGTVAAAQGK